MSQLPEPIQEILGIPSNPTTGATASSATCVTTDPTKKLNAAEKSFGAKVKDNSKTNAKTAPPRPTHGPGKSVRVELEVSPKKSK